MVSGAIVCVMAAVLVGCGSGTGQGNGTNTPGTGGGAGSPTAGARSSGGVGGAHVTKPFDRAITGAQCYAGTGANKGKAAYGFPDRDLTAAALSFTLGPLTDGSSPGQEHNTPYTGAGSYDNIGIVVRTESGAPVIGYGVVTVNSDLKTGSFKLNGDSAEGTWDCGSPVTP
jgi:hypothetical protein